MNYEQLKPLLEWRVGTLQGWTPWMLVKALSVESLADKTVPEGYYAQVVGFRRKRTDDRMATCRRFLLEQQPGPELVRVPREALMKLLDFGASMLANEASAGRQRPHEDYSAVWGGEDEVFTGYHEELEMAAMERLKKDP